MDSVAARTLCPYGYPGDRTEQSAEKASTGMAATRGLPSIWAVLHRPALETDPHILDRQVFAER